MYDIVELIKYYPEGEFLDFKQEEYNENNKPHLIKDVLSLANASVKGDGYIIIGIHKKDLEINVFNIDSQFDSAHIQQYIHSNITPELGIEYYPYAYEGKNLMILTIKAPSEQPYMTIKDVKYPGGKICLKAHECWIRKGSYQLTATRQDIDKMYVSRNEQTSFIGNIRITFSGSEADSIQVSGLKNLEFPSDKNAKEIKKIIKQKEELMEKNPFSYQLSISQPMIPWQGTTYEERDLDTLKKNLKEIKKTYADEDYYYLFEKKAFKLNLDILNEGVNYLEDASIEIKIPKIDKILIADQVHYVHRSNSNPLIPYTPRTPSFDELNYPMVNEENGFFIITENLGNLKHNIKQEAFKTPLRLAIGSVDGGREIFLYCKIYGKNVKKPIEKELRIIVE